jgi:hypothetical protein
MIHKINHRIRTCAWIIASRNEITVEESNRRTHEKAIQNRPINTTKSYTKKTTGVYCMCDKRQFAFSWTLTVTSNKLHLFLEEEVVNRPRKVQRKKRKNRRFYFWKDYLIVFEPFTFAPQLCCLKCRRQRPQIKVSKTWCWFVIEVIILTNWKWIVELQSSPKRKHMHKLLHFKVLWVI